MKATFFAIFSIMVAFGIQITNKDNDDQDDSDYICDGNHDNEMQYNDIMEYSEDLKDEATDENQKERTEQKKIVKSNVMASLQNSNQVKKQTAAKKVENATTVASANVTKAKTPVADQNVGVVADIRHNDSVPQTQNVTKNVTLTKNNTQNTTIAQKNNTKTTEKQSLGKKIQLQKFDMKSVQTRQKPKQSMPQQQKKENVTAAAVKNTTQQVQKNQIVETKAIVNASKNASQQQNTTSTVNVTEKIAAVNTTAQNSTKSLVQSKETQKQNQTAVAEAKVTKISHEATQKKKILTKTEKVAEKIGNTWFQVGRGNSIKIEEIVPESAQEEQPETSDEDAIKALYPMKSKHGSVSGAIESLVARQSKVETKAEQMVTEDDYSIPDSSQVADRAMEDIGEMSRKQVNYQLKKHMKDGILDEVNHDEEVIDSAMSFQQAIEKEASVVVPEIKVKSTGGILDLVQDMGSMDQLLGSAAQEENSLISGVVGTPSGKDAWATQTEIQPEQTTTTKNYIFSDKLSNDNINHMDPNRQLFQNMAQHLGPKPQEEEKADDPNDTNSVAHSRLQAAKVTAQMKTDVAKVDKRKEIADQVVEDTKSQKLVVIEKSEGETNIKQLKSLQDSLVQFQRTASPEKIQQLSKKLGVEIVTEDIVFTQTPMSDSLLQTHLQNNQLVQKAMKIGKNMNDINQELLSLSTTE